MFQEARPGQLDGVHPATERRRSSSAALSCSPSARGLVLSVLASCMAAVQARSPCAACLGDSNAALSPAPGASFSSSPASAASNSLFTDCIGGFYGAGQRPALHRHFIGTSGNRWHDARHARCPPGSPHAELRDARLQRSRRPAAGGAGGAVGAARAGRPGGADRDRRRQPRRHRGHRAARGCPRGPPSGESGPGRGLSRNFGKEAALSAGLDAARGDAW